jgi:hypothetical protein
MDLSLKAINGKLNNHVLTSFIFSTVNQNIRSSLQVSEYRVDVKEKVVEVNLVAVTPSFKELAEQTEKFFEMKEKGDIQSFSVSNLSFEAETKRAKFSVNIIFDKSLGQASPTSTTASVAGVFLADNQIIIEATPAGNNDLKFIGEGMFIGWQGVQMNRKYVPQAPNASNPTEFFRYRPDLLLNVPASMMTPLAVWQETN